MAKLKVTFTLDRSTISRLREAAERLAKPQSQVVREAIQEYHERIGKLTEQERLRMLQALEEIMARPPSRPQREVESEINAVRQARRQGGRKSIEARAR